MRKERIGKIGYRICAVLAAAVSLWCMGDNLWPVVKENGAAWALRAAGLQAATSQEVPQAEASPAPQKEAVKETEPEATSLPTATPVPVQEKTDTELPVLPAPTPDPERETAAVAATFMGGGEEINGFFVKDTSDSGLDLSEEILIDPDVHVKRDGSPVVLFYSTHTSEAYLQYESDWYYRDESFRTEEEEKSVVAVAKRAKDVIEAGGFGVIHDTTRFDETYSGSYQRSMDAMQENLLKYPTIQITVDVHRDAFGEEDDGTRYKPVAEVNGENAAQIMIMAGCDLSEDPLFPDWRENLHLALRLQQKAIYYIRAVSTAVFCAEKLQYARHARLAFGGGRHRGEYAKGGGLRRGAAGRDDSGGFKRHSGGIAENGRGILHAEVFCMRKCVCSRAFLMSFFCTVLVLLFVFGMLMVDAEGRRLSFNDNAPPAEMLYQADGKAFLKINAFELDARIPVTGAVKVWRFLEKFFCLPQSSDGEHG